MDRSNFQKSANIFHWLYKWNAGINVCVTIKKTVYGNHHYHHIMIFNQQYTLIIARSALIRTKSPTRTQENSRSSGPKSGFHRKLRLKSSTSDFENMKFSNPLDHFSEKFHFLDWTTGSGPEWEHCQLVQCTIYMHQIQYSDVETGAWWKNKTKNRIVIGKFLFILVDDRWMEQPSMIVFPVTM